MKRTVLPFAAIAALFALSLVSCSKQGSNAPGVDSTKATTGTMTPVERGKYLVTIGSCNDCHTPWKMGPNGPEPDMTKMLSGHPQDMKMPPAPQLPMPWMAMAGATMTAWSGPWGTSFTANLTPDSTTGLGKYSEADFVKALRTGKMLGTNRPIMPPMPWEYVGKMTDEDLAAVYAYLQSIPPVHNQVPDYMPPGGGPGGAPPPMPPMSGKPGVPPPAHK